MAEQPDKIKSDQATGCDEAQSFDGVPAFDRDGGPKFIHLRVRSPYSLLEGALKIKSLAKWCKDYRMPAIGLTDTNNLCGALEFSEIMAGQGVQPIIGCTLSVDLERPSHPGEIHREPDGSFVLIAQNETGYQRLMELSSSAYLDVAATDLPHITWTALGDKTDGLLALTGGYDGWLNRLIRDGEIDEARRRLMDLKALFPDRLYVELQRHSRPDEAASEAACEAALLDLAYDLKLPIVATNEPYFEDRYMHAAHDALLAISEGSYILEKDRRHVTPDHFLKTADQMVQLFSDLPEALANSVDIARRISFRPLTRDPILPSFGDGTQGETDILAQQARAGLADRLAKLAELDGLAATEADYYERLDFELDIISQMGFPGYFLIVSDFIKWAKEQGIPVGPGRGSGAGSVVAWSLLITDLDPLRYGLLFERFLNPERVSMPDFDIDFCQERRGEVIRYVQQKYGDDQVAHIITFGTLQARAVVRDVGRVMQMPLGQVDRLAKLVPSNPANPVSLQEAINMEPRLQEARDSEAAVQELLTIALQLEGLYRNASTHAAGVVIGDRPLTQLVPLYRDPRSDIPATQFNMKWVEQAGLVKFDFLGLKTLTVIDRALKYLAEQDIHLDLDSVSVRDPRAYEPLADGASDGVFQLESSGMRDVLRKMKPDSIEELTALISLYRPGPMKNIDDYINRKKGLTEITYPHPSLQTILEETYGIIIYQEQVMQIAQVLSGYSLGEADMLRRAMGKKIQSEMDKQRDRFVQGAKKNDVAAKLANEIFDLVNEFAGYGFNKSHAAAYAMISFRTAYLKAHHPAQFMAASMSLDIANTDKLAQFHAEVKRLELEVIPPCVNRTYADFAVRENKILYAMGALKNVGVSAMQHVVEVREQGGPFKDLFDFARRVDTRIVNKRAFENLARGGAFDCLEPDRARAFAAASTLQSIGVRAAQERNSSQVSLFGDADLDMSEPDLPDAAPWSEIEALDHERSSIGFYLSGHPLDSHMEALKHHILAADLEHSYGTHRGPKLMRLAGVVCKRAERLSQRGKRFAYVEMSDPTGAYEIFVGEELLGAQRDILTAGSLIDVTVKAEMRDGELKLFSNKIAPLSTQARPAAVKALRIYLADASCADALSRRIESFKNAPSETYGTISVVFPLDDAEECELQLKGKHAMEKAVYNALRSVPGVEKIDRLTA